MIRTAIVFIAACSALTWAGAQNIYKCGSVYSQAPCPGGTVVQTDDPRSAEQQRQTAAAAQRDAKAAAALEKDRLKQEAQRAPAYIPAPRQEAARSASGPVMTRPEKPKHFTAIAPAKPGDAKADKKKKNAAQKAAREKASKA